MWTVLKGTYHLPNRVREQLRQSLNWEGDLLREIESFYSEYELKGAPLGLLRDTLETFMFNTEHKSSTCTDSQTINEMYDVARESGFLVPSYSARPGIRVWAKEIVDEIESKFGARLQSADCDRKLYNLLVLTNHIIALGIKSLRIAFPGHSIEGADGTFGRAHGLLGDAVIVESIRRFNLVPKGEEYSYLRRLTELKIQPYRYKRCEHPDGFDIILTFLSHARNRAVIAIQNFAAQTHWPRFNSVVEAHPEMREGINHSVSCEPELIEKPQPMALFFVLLENPNDEGSGVCCSFGGGNMSSHVLSYGPNPERDKLHSAHFDILNLQITGSVLLCPDGLITGQSQARFAPVPSGDELYSRTLRNTRTVYEALYKRLFDFWTKFPEIVSFADPNKPSAIIYQGDAAFLLVVSSSIHRLTPYCTCFEELTAQEREQLCRRHGLQAKSSDSVRAYRIWKAQELGESPKEAAFEKSPYARIREYFAAHGYPSYQSFINHLIRNFGVIEAHGSVGKGSHGALFRNTPEGRFRFVTCTSTRQETESVKPHIVIEVLEQLKIGVGEYLVSL